MYLIINTHDSLINIYQIYVLTKVENIDVDVYIELLVLHKF